MPHEETPAVWELTAATVNLQAFLTVAAFLFCVLFNRLLFFCIFYLSALVSLLLSTIQKLINSNNKRQSIKSAFVTLLWIKTAFIGFD